MVGLVSRDAPLRCLSENSCIARCRSEVGTERTPCDGQQDEVFPSPRPGERIIRIVSWLWNKDSLVQILSV